MYKALKDNKIIAISDTDSEFPCLVCDAISSDTEHTTSDYVEVNGEYVLNTDDKAIEKKKQARISELKQMLSDADYWGQKYLDGEYTDEEWQEKVAIRKSWREEIRQLESEDIE